MQFTKQDFFTETLRFRELMGSRSFWAASEETRDRAVRGYGFLYTNADIDQSCVDIFVSTMTEYSRRDWMMLAAPPPADGAADPS